MRPLSKFVLLAYKPIHVRRVRGVFISNTNLIISIPSRSSTKNTTLLSAFTIVTVAVAASIRAASVGIAYVQHVIRHGVRVWEITEGGADRGKNCRDLACDFSVLGAIRWSGEPKSRDWRHGDRHPRLACMSEATRSAHHASITRRIIYGESKHPCCTVG